MKNLALNNELINAFRSVLGKTEEGRLALNWLLVDMGYFDEIDPSDTEAVVLRNYATRMLRLLGISHECNALDITKALLSVRPIVFKKEDEE